jgi:hypothetical protein
MAVEHRPTRSQGDSALKDSTADGCQNRREQGSSLLQPFDFIGGNLVDKSERQENEIRGKDLMHRCQEYSEEKGVGDLG